MKKTAFSLLALLALAPAFSAEAASSWSLNAGAVSDYRYRGISQTRLQPSLQGGVDYAAPAGVYAGAWASTIRWVRDAGGEASAELDVYGGYKAEVAPGLTLDVGLLQYVYPGNRLQPSANTLEAYAGLSFGPVTARYSHSTTPLFGFSDSRGSSYLDLSASLDLGDGFTLTPHVGHQTVRRNAAASYTDASLTLAKEVSGLVLSAALVGTGAGRAAYTSAVGAKFLGRTGAVLGLKKTF